jgi:hypothetical protein
MTKKAAKLAPELDPITPVPFGETAGADVFNASEIVPVADSRFLFCDNNLGDCLLELTLDADGRMAGPLVRRPLVGLADAAVDDLEGMAIVDDGRRKLIFVTPSLSLKGRKRKTHRKAERGKLVPARSGLLRVRVGRHGRLEAELIPDLRGWLLAHSKRLRRAARFLPDDGGLNVEALGWDPERQALLFGVRTPVPKRGPMVARARIRDLGGPWTTDNLEYLPPVFLRVEDVGEEQGIRSMEYIPSLGASLVITGNSTSRSKAPFRLHLWDGNEEGRTRLFERVRFADGMKPEGVTYGTVGGRPAIVFVDDGGGYRVLFEDDPRLAG